METAREPSGVEPRAIRVLCVDDDDSTVRFYQFAIDAEPDMQCVGTLTTLQALAAEIERCHPTVLVLDLSIPGWSTLEVLAETKRRFPDLRALIVSGFEDDARVERAFQHGADGFLVKSLQLEDFVAAVRRFARGERVVPRNYLPSRGGAAGPAKT